KKSFVLNSLLFDIIYLLHCYFFLLIKFKAAVPHLTAWVAFSTSSVDVFEILDDNVLIDCVNLKKVPPNSSTPYNPLSNLADLFVISVAKSFVFSNKCVVSVVIPSTCFSTPSNVLATLLSVFFAAVNVCAI